MAVAAMAKGKHVVTTETPAEGDILIGIRCDDCRRHNVTDPSLQQVLTPFIFFYLPGTRTVSQLLQQRITGCFDLSVLSLQESVSLWKILHLPWAMTEKCSLLWIVSPLNGRWISSSWDSRPFVADQGGQRHQWCTRTEDVQ